MVEQVSGYAQLTLLPSDRRGILRLTFCCLPDIVNGGFALDGVLRACMIARSLFGCLLLH